MKDWGQVLRLDSLITTNVKNGSVNYRNKTIMKKKVRIKERLVENRVWPPRQRGKGVDGKFKQGNEEKVIG